MRDMAQAVKTDDLDRARIAVVFHGIGTPPRVLEPGEGRYWLAADHFARCLDEVAALSDPAAVWISFDDGNASDHDFALPMLLERGLTADFFALTGRIGQAGSLSAAQLRGLRAAGMGVGSHGVDHLNWRTIPAETLQHELAASRAVLEQICGAPVQRASVPFGRYNRRVVEALRAAGYATVGTNDGGALRPGAYLLPRTNVRADMSPADFRALICGEERLSRRIRRVLTGIRRRFV